MIIRIPFIQRALVVETPAGALRREMAAGYADTAAIQRDLERCLEAEDRSSAAFWVQMRADGVPVAKPAEPDLAVTHDCPGPGCHPYPAFGDDPVRWGLLPEPPMTDAELEAAAEFEAEP